MRQNDKRKKEINLDPRKVEVTPQDEKFLKEFLAVVEKKISDEDFDIDALCKKLLVSRATLFRKIKKITKKTPNEFIQSYRLKRAAQLLRDDFGNVTEVAEAVGFSDQFYFSKCFKKKYGQPPKQYQLEQLKKRENELKIEQEVDGKRIVKAPQSELLTEPSIGALDQELIARSAQMLAKQQSSFKDLKGTPQRDELFKQFIKYYDLNLTLNETLNYYSTDEIILKLRQMIDNHNKEIRRAGIYSDKRLEFFDITDNRVRSNAHAVAVVCKRVDLHPHSSDYSQLKVKNYGQTFNLHESELFYNQPVGAGPMCTGVLVGEDVIATAAHFANEKNVIDLRFVFYFVMLDPTSPIEKIPHDNIYKGVEILERVHNPEGDWTLVKLDRKVTGRGSAELSQRNIFPEQPVYVIGHPCGLPLKYAPGAQVSKATGTYFWADLDVYSSSSGSPLFCAETHELIGIVSRGKAMDFRWTENGWLTMRYPKTDPDYKGSQCSRVSQFTRHIKSP